MTTIQIEKIPTGLTANYVPYWNVKQALKEAMQNIAYGSIKSGVPAKIYFDAKAQMMAIKDKYIGFDKKYLYIGESEQKEDELGLGTFGEGWKIFLLVMAREKINHKVATVGFTFWGELESTPHGISTLVINITENQNQKGTKVYADVEEKTWHEAAESFAVLQGIKVEDLTDSLIIPNRKNELWVNGVRIENGDSTNPLKLHYSFNLNQRDLINRDRSHVNTELAYESIKKLIFGMEDEQIKEYLSMALEGSDFEDVLRGPYIPAVGSPEQKKKWLDIIARLHASNPENLIIPSYNQVVNGQAKKKGFVLLDTPRKWDFELSYLGIRKADDVIDDQYDIVEEKYYGGSSSEPATEFAKVKERINKILKLNNELPEFRYVSEIKNPVSSDKKYSHYDSGIDVIYIDTSIMNNPQLLVESILPEIIVWKYKAKTAEEFENAYKAVLVGLINS